MAVKLLLICFQRVYSVCAWLCITLSATSKVNGGLQSLSLFWGSQAEKFGNHCLRTLLYITNISHISHKEGMGQRTKEKHAQDNKNSVLVE